MANFIYPHHRQEWEASAIAHKELTECLEILESLGIPSDWGLMLLPLIQAEVIGSEGE